MTAASSHSARRDAPPRTCGRTDLRAEAPDEPSLQQIQDAAHRRRRRVNPRSAELSTRNQRVRPRRLGPPGMSKPQSTLDSQAGGREPPLRVARKLDGGRWARSSAKDRLTIEAGHAGRSRLRTDATRCRGSGRSAVAVDRTAVDEHHPDIVA
jgi:hypothetical protein